ncbi:MULTISPECIES: MAE_28990/MAE_18760 family HEPN-like nuclease [Alteromonas]|uniref:MAE_28990/MAE_18760 family HEPN-like nuclease n=1 Tax=Alteromonas TaxID=226 RepID=UPI001279F40D|nr:MULTISPECIES: HEPN domain-containing protein [Alteromonas]CAI2388391.1 hypothetical protein ALT831_00299 [Alteromonas macleodii]CAI3927826.1 hypothetical protein ALTBGP6_00299 [Alteromonas macleodii]CAI3927991.1 hypothetical protein ALTBGP14_00299 [Alteromonas macleodii]CAI3928072.1 hypothetical protein ALTBGP9_00299 [Alteromonas macleodii]VTO37987.1 hypothetical protein ALTBGP6_00299 [Alteromonas macleodii]|tara:strand:- start:255 stop:983 length:729 start_codon:yes stop_codon:yes gene_type:complete
MQELQSFDAIQDFNESLDEVETLIRLAIGYEKLNKHDKRSLILRSALLFLGTHLECFFESIAEEYIYRLEQMSLKREQLPEKLILSSVQHQFTDELIKKIKSGNPKCKQDIVMIAKTIECDQPVTEINVDTKFSYGRHGSSIVKKLFARLDINDVFKSCVVTTEVESLLSDEPEIVTIDVEKKFNALTGVRNGLIHENKSPNAATFNSILSDIPHYRNFAKGLGCLLNDKLNEIRKNASVAA